MPWIESHSVLGRHRKTKALARQLKIKIPEAVGYLHLFWHSVLEQAEDGDLTGWEIEAIADLAQYKGDPAVFLAALQDCNLLDRMRIHGWIKFSGRYLITKYKTRQTERLREIWGKHGRVYGKRGRVARNRAGKGGVRNGKA